METPSFILMKQAFMSDSQIYADSQHEISADQIATDVGSSVRQDEVEAAGPERPFMVRKSLYY